MENLIEQIKGSIKVPYVSEMDAVFNGCFTVEPFMISSLRGDGVPVTAVDHYQVNLFYADRKKMICAAKALYQYLKSTKGCACEDPSLQYETNIGLWRAIIVVQKVSV